MGRICPVISVIDEIEQVAARGTKMRAGRRLQSGERGRRRASILGRRGTKKPNGCFYALMEVNTQIHPLDGQVREYQSLSNFDNVIMAQKG
jgi:hypothetical protein